MYHCVLLPTYSQQRLVVVDVLGGQRWTHADGEGRQRQAGQQPRQQELELHLVLVGRHGRSLASDQRLAWRLKKKTQNVLLS